MRRSSRATPVPISHRQAHAGDDEDDRLHYGCAELAAGEQRAVIGEAVPDNLVAEQLQEPEVLERGGEEPDDRVTQQEPEEARAGRIKKTGKSWRRRERRQLGRLAPRL